MMPPYSFHLKWTLVAPLHAFTSPDMALIINRLPTSIQQRCEALRRYNLPTYASATQSASDYLATRHLRPLLPATPCWFQTFHDQVQANLFIEMRIRWALRRLVHRFRIRRIDRLPLVMTDPITFSPIVNAITVYDRALKRKFVFDAKPLVKHVTNCLFRHEQLVPCSKAPFNVITNRPFTWEQLLSITQQVIRAGISSGHLPPFQAHSFDIQRWKTYKGPDLLIAAIKDEIFNHDSIDGREVLIDFLIGRLRDLRILVLPEFEDILSDAIEWFPSHSVVQTLRSLCLRYYEANILNIKIKQVMLHLVHSFYLKEFRSSGLWRLTHERRLLEN
jgi:hypothetical protein